MPLRVYESASETNGAMLTSRMYSTSSPISLSPPCTRSITPTAKPIKDLQTSATYQICARLQHPLRSRHDCSLRAEHNGPVTAVFKLCIRDSNPPLNSSPTVDRCCVSNRPHRSNSQPHQNIPSDRADIAGQESMNSLERAFRGRLMEYEPS